MDSLFDSLSAIQREAVRHKDGPLLILAGPGSGKTRVVTHRIAYLLREGVAAEQILALTFTNKASNEMRGRVESLAPNQPVWISTFHRFAARLLRHYAPLVGLAESFTIYDSDDSRQVIGRLLKASEYATAKVTPEQIAGAISSAKNRLITAELYEPIRGHPLGQVVADIYPAYQARLLASSAVDFDDLLLHVVNLLKDNPDLRRTLDARYKYILVDEYQDTNRAQYAMLRALSIDHPNLATTGDPDQSIYGWRGANLKNILEFEHDFPDVRVVRLEHNYRSTKSIVAVAGQLIKQNVHRKPKLLSTENKSGAPVRLVSYATQDEEAEGIAERIERQIKSGGRTPGDFAIFYRVNALSRSLETALRARRIPFQLIHALEFYQRKEVKDVLAYARLVNNPCDDQAFLRTINTPSRGIGKKTIERIVELAHRSGIPMLEAARQAGDGLALPNAATKKVSTYVAIFDSLVPMAAGPVEQLLGHILVASGYRRQLEESELETDWNRLANLEELLTDARQFDERTPDDNALETFLEQSALVQDTDDWDDETEKVSLMTLHGAKGLEFPVVFLLGAEEGLLPHERSLRDPHQLEEERRLLFVGITRAIEELQLSYARKRDYRGQRRTTIPSAFLMELPRSEMDCISEGWAEPAEPMRARAPARRPTTRPAVRRGASPVTTAACLVGEPAAKGPVVGPDGYRQGMRVVHPKYGLGKVVALYGAGESRTATVAFVTAGQIKFVLSKSPLRPASR